MKHLLIKIILGFLASFIGYVLGWIIGAGISGNYFDTIRFAGQVGYEAGGLIFALVLSVLLAGVSVWQIEKRKIEQIVILSGAIFGGIVSCATVWIFSTNVHYILAYLTMILPGLGAVIWSEIALRLKA